MNLNEENTKEKQKKKETIWISHIFPFKQKLRHLDKRSRCKRRKQNIRIDNVIKIEIDITKNKSSESSQSIRKAEI